MNPASAPQHWGKQPDVASCHISPTCTYMTPIALWTRPHHSNKDGQLRQTGDIASDRSV